MRNKKGIVIFILLILILIYVYLSIFTNNFDDNTTINYLVLVIKR